MVYSITYRRITSVGEKPRYVNEHGQVVDGFPPNDDPFDDDVTPAKMAQTPQGWQQNAGALLRRTIHMAKTTPPTVLMTILLVCMCMWYIAGTVYSFGAVSQQDFDDMVVNAVAFGSDEWDKGLHETEEHEQSDDGGDASEEEDEPASNLHKDVIHLSEEVSCVVVDEIPLRNMPYVGTDRQKLLPLENYEFPTKYCESVLDALAANRTIAENFINKGEGFCYGFIEFGEKRNGLVFLDEDTGHAVLALNPVIVQRSKGVVVTWKEKRGSFGRSMVKRSTRIILRYYAWKGERFEPTRKELAGDVSLCVQQWEEMVRSE